MKYENYKVFECGDQALLLEFGDSIDLETNQLVQKIFYALASDEKLEVVETVPCYRSILVYYDPLLVDLKNLAERIRELIERVNSHDSINRKRIKIPIVYGAEFGPDIDFVARYHQISIEEVINIHLQQTYINSMFGFDPGFATLIGLPPELETPRLEDPRLKVPAGSVGIGGVQTGIYSFERAGGWQLIGRTPLKMFALNRDPQVLIEIGDEVKFIRISKEEYTETLKKMERGEESISKYIEQ